MLPRSVNYIFFGFESLQSVQRCIEEPVESIQIIAQDISKIDEQDLRSAFGHRLEVLLSADHLKQRPQMRVFLHSDQKSFEDLYYEWSGRQDFPFVVTVKESHRSDISKKNRLQDFAPNIDLLLRELVK